MYFVVYSLKQTFPGSPERETNTSCTPHPGREGFPPTSPAGLSWPFSTVPGKAAWKSHACVSGAQGHRARSGHGGKGATPAAKALPRESRRRCPALTGRLRHRPGAHGGGTPGPCAGRAASRSACCGGGKAAPLSPPP